jgi:hypothetical protein
MPGRRKWRGDVIISFAWTTDAFLAHRKTCTRRSWDDLYASRFRKGQIHDAWTKSPRFFGHKVGQIRLTMTPYQQRTSLMTEEDYELEGLKWMEEQGLTIRKIHPRKFFEDWKNYDETVWVVKFDPIIVNQSGDAIQINNQIRLPLF